MRGPASAVWGANALTGVVNIITKTPARGRGRAHQRHADRRRLRPRRGRAADDGLGHELRRAASALARRPERHAGPTGSSAGYFNSDAAPAARPARIPRRIPRPARRPGRHGRRRAYPAIDRAFGRLREQRHQPAEGRRARSTRSWRNGGRITYSAGYAGTEGIVHTGIGPFDIQSGSLPGLRPGRATPRAAFKVGGLREPAGRRGAEPAAADPHGQARAAELQDQDLRPRDRPLRPSWAASTS